MFPPFGPKYFCRNLSWSFRINVEYFWNICGIFHFKYFVTTKTKRLEEDLSNSKNNTVKKWNVLLNINYWYSKNQENKRIIVISSMPSRGKSKDDEDFQLSIKDFFMYSWNLDEYNIWNFFPWVTWVLHRFIWIFTLNYLDFYICLFKTVNILENI